MRTRRVRKPVQRHGRRGRRPQRMGEVRARLAGRHRPSAAERHARARPCRRADDAAAGARRHDSGERVLVRVTRAGDAVVHRRRRAAGGDRRARGAGGWWRALRLSTGEPLASEPGRREGAMRTRPAKPSSGRGSSASPSSAMRSRAQRFGSSGSTGSGRDVRHCAFARRGAGSASHGTRRASAGAASTATRWSSTAAGCGRSAPKSSSLPGRRLSGWREASIASGSMPPIGRGTADAWVPPASAFAADPSGPDVLVQPEDVVRIPLALECDQPLGLCLAVDRRHTLVGLRDVVHVAPG